MTNLDLQEALITEVKEVLEHQSIKRLDGETWKDFNVYRQDKPYKDDDEDEAQENYIIVMLDDEDTDSEGRWIVTVHMLISAYVPFNEDTDHQGNMIIANIMNQIDLHLCKKGIIADMYEMEPQRKKRFNQECYQNYYECDYITKWKLPEINIEGIRDLV